MVLRFREEPEKETEAKRWDMTGLEKEAFISCESISHNECMYVKIKHERIDAPTVLRDLDMKY